MIYIFLALFFYTIAILVATAATRHANTNLVSLIANFFSVLIPLAVVAPAFSKKMVSGHKFGILLAATNGIVVGLFVLAINKSFSVNKVGIVTPIVMGGAIILSTIASYFIFKEKISWVEGTGLLLMFAGLAVVTYARATA